MTTTHQSRNPVRKIRDMNGSKQLTIEAEIARLLDIDDLTFAEEIVQKDGTLLVKFHKPTGGKKK